MNFSTTLIPEGLSLSKPIILGLLVLVIIAWIGMSVIFVFHWKRYGMKERFIVIAESVYFLVSGLLIAIALGFFLMI
ncbi:MAG: hypothetical protein Q7S86_05200 [bacterium]|nr:hypothetical protein [bacterium]